MLLSAPAVLLPGALLRFPLPKLTVLALAVGLAAGVTAAGRLPTWAVAVGSAGGLLLITAALTSPAPVAQALGRWPRYEGLVALPVYGGAVWAGARLLGPSGPAARRRTSVLVVSAVAMAVAAVALLEAAGLRPLSSDVSRPGSLLGNATDQGIVGAVALTVLLPAAVALRTWWSAAGLFASVLAVATSSSRAAVLAALVGLLVIGALAALVDGPRSVPVRAAVTVAAALGAAAAALPATRARLSGEGLAGRTFEGRRLLWSDSLSLVLDRPVLGVGPSGFVDALPGHQGLRWAVEVGGANPPDSPHNWLLQAWSAGGLVLAVLAVVSAALVLVAGWRAVRSAPPADGWWWSGACGAVVVGLVAWASHPSGPGTVAAVAPFAGALVAAAPSGSPTRRRTAGSQLVGAGAAVWCLALAAASLAELPLRSGYAAAARGDVPGAERAFSLARALRPWDPDMGLLAAGGLVPAAEAGVPGSARAAVREAERALRRVPEGLEARRALALALELDGDLSGARTAWEQVVAAAPADADARLQLGVVAAQLDDLTTARHQLEQAARLSPDSPGPWQNLAQVAELRGDAAAAARARREAARRGG